MPRFSGSRLCFEGFTSVIVITSLFFPAGLSFSLHVVKVFLLSLYYDFNCTLTSANYLLGTSFGFRIDLIQKGPRRY